MAIKVEIKKEDGTIDIYRFTQFDSTLVLTGLDNQFKPEGKRVWKIKTMWDKYNNRNSIIGEPELTEELKKLAFEEMVKTIKVKTWKEFKPNS